MNMPTRRDVALAAERILPHIIRTPVLRNRQLDERAGTEIWMKCENLQVVGAFKARGAINNLLQLTDDERSRGVLTYSSGNHAQAVAWAAAKCDTRATICMPVDAPAIKVAGVRAHGGHVVFAGTTSLERRERALEIQRETHAVIVEPFDHPDTICGQATATRELLEEVDAAGHRLEALVVPVGGGGVLAGACLASEGRTLKLMSVEPVGCDALRQSLDADRLVPVEPGATLADGLKPTQIGKMNFAILRERVTQALTVNDTELGDALISLLFAAKVLVEPSGAAALAAVLRGLPGNPARVGVILTGGNLAPEVLTQLTDRHGPSFDSR